jgi:DNA-binding Lrp family transcriptional regulator
MAALPLPDASTLPAVARQRLMHGLTLDDQPFDILGAPLGMDGDAVIDLLRQWVGQGRVERVGMVLSESIPPTANARDQALDQALLAACASGLPLVRRPYEALGAMLGVPASRVQARLADWLRCGRLLRIAAVPASRLP